MPSSKPQEAYGYHIDRGNGTVRGPRYDSSEYERKIEVGKTFKATGRLKMCEVGCHASFALSDASRFRILKNGRTISYVKVWGDLRIGDRKVMGRFRKVLATYKIDDDVPVIEKKVFTGVSDPVTVEVVDPKWVEKIEKKLTEDYRRNKRRVDEMDRVIELKK